MFIFQVFISFLCSLGYVFKLVLYFADSGQQKLSFLVLSARFLLLFVHIIPPSYFAFCMLVSQLGICNTGWLGPLFRLGISEHLNLGNLTVSLLSIVFLLFRFSVLCSLSLH